MEISGLFGLKNEFLRIPAPSLPKYNPIEKIMALLSFCDFSIQTAVPIWEVLPRKWSAPMPGGWFR
jgi:hypothetical protein